MISDARRQSPRPRLYHHAPVPPKRNVPLHAFGRAARELRARRDLSQEELGYRSGLHRNYVGAFERGEINPTFKVLLKLSRGLSMQLSEVVENYERHRDALELHDPVPRPQPPRGPHGRITG
jgi:ribosome-binding protein aMBF1 (putative translation factor)